MISTKTTAFSFPVVSHCCGRLDTLMKLAVIENAICALGILIPSVIFPEISSISSFGGYIAISGSPSV